MSLRKLIVICLFAGICSGVLFSLTEAIIQIGVTPKAFVFASSMFITLLLGYWIPPFERTISFKRWIAYCLIFCSIGFFFMKVLQ